MRLLSWNVRSLRDDPEAVGRVLREHAPDVVTLQEAPRLLRWRSKRAALARQAGLVVAGAERVGGLDVLVHLRVTAGAARLVPLSPHRGQHQRAVLAVPVELDGTRWTAVSTHLGLDPVERVTHAQELTAALSGSPLVIGADLNEEPGGSARRVLADTWVDLGFTDPRPTFSTGAPRHRLDTVLTTPDVRCLSYDVLDGPDVRRASDHHPVLVELALG